MNLLQRVTSTTLGSYFSYWATQQAVIHAQALATEAWRRRQVKPSYSLNIIGTDPVFYKFEKWIVDQVVEVDDFAKGYSTIFERKRDSSSNKITHYEVNFLRALKSGNLTWKGFDFEFTFHIQSMASMMQMAMANSVGESATPVTEDGSEADIEFTNSYINSRGSDKLTLNISTASEEGLDEIKKLIVQWTEEVSIAEYGSTKAPRLTVKTIDRWGNGWERLQVPARPLETVALTEETRSLIDDLTEFVSLEDKYSRLSIPFRRGYLLTGPPGTGKTSFIKALASHFNFDLCMVSLSAIPDDKSLVSMFNELSRSSSDKITIVVLEDLDSFNITHDRSSKDGKEQKTESGITLSGLLNCLDGIYTPHGMVVIAATNRPEVLDSALVRPGRFDKTVKVDYLDQDQAHQMFDIFYERPDLPTNLSICLADKITGADLSEIMRTNMDDPYAAEAELKRLVANKQVTS